ncbi:MAG: RDD family protein [Candidatus Azotimanducaceae bacterium]|mgnify:FL=1|tara:strand:+ start:546 stop:980 length:435 start_codon:yes stop_codon:yes gene_type:complete
MDKEYQSAGLFRRLAAILYDSLLIIAMWLITTLLLVAFINDGAALQGPLFQFGLYFEACLFYSYFWRLRGQTLGMQVWKIKLVSPSLQTLSWQECFARLFFALVSVSMLGLGFIWMLFDPDRLTWHDRASGTRVVLLRKIEFED